MSAFTLVELLVVITIVSLLVSLLIPTMTQARDAAKRSICASNIRTHVFGVASGATDNKSIIPSGGSMRSVLSHGASTASTIATFSNTQLPPDGLACASADAYIYGNTNELYMTDCWSGVNGQSYPNNCKEYYTGLGMALYRRINVSPATYYCPFKATRISGNGAGARISAGWTAPVPAIPKYLNSWGAGINGDITADSDYAFRGWIYSPSRNASSGYPAYTYNVWKHLDDWGSKSCVVDYDYAPYGVSEGDGQRYLFDSTFDPRGWNIGYYDGHVRFYGDDPARTLILYQYIHGVFNYFSGDQYGTTGFDSSNSAFFREMYDRM